MPLIVIKQCPHCGKSHEYSGKNLEGVTLDTKEGWIMECPYCKNVFGDFNTINTIEDN